MKELETGLKHDMKKLEIGLKHGMKELEIGLKHNMKELESSIIIKLGGLIVTLFAVSGTLLAIFKILGKA